MVIKVSTLKKLLNIKEAEIKKFDVDQLRIMLGVFRYLTRLFEREINQRANLDGPHIKLKPKNQL